MLYAYKMREIVPILEVEQSQKNITDMKRNHVE